MLCLQKTWFDKKFQELHHHISKTKYKWMMFFYGHGRMILYEGHIPLNSYMNYNE
jgi:hypothetical protein